MALYLQSVIIILVVAATYVSGEEKCPPDEVYDECQNCEPTCRYPDPSKHKPCVMLCFKGCACKKGLVRRESDNKCVPLDQCPGRKSPKMLTFNGREKCPPGEVYDKCRLKPNCEPTCQFPDPDLRGKRCFKRCFRGCVCKKGLVRRKEDNKCVPLNQCPGRKSPKMMTSNENLPPKCPPGEVFVSESDKDPDCLPSCRYPKGGPGPNKDGQCPMACHSGCVCKEGLLRREKDNKCVPPSQCPEDEQCKPGEVYEECHGDPDCLPSCKHPKGKKERCNLMCHYGCICMKHLVRRESDQKCVKPSECQGKKSPPKLLNRRPGRKC